MYELPKMEISVPIEEHGGTLSTIKYDQLKSQGNTKHQFLRGKNLSEFKIHEFP